MHVGVVASFGAQYILVGDTSLCKDKVFEHGQQPKQTRIL